jgi:GNAT superfamily N-acetyltransferase
LPEQILFDYRGMEPTRPGIALRYVDQADQLHVVEPLWNALQEHHSSLVPNLGGSAPKREPAEAWRRRRAKYERWLEDPETFFVLAEDGDRPVGYAFVTVGSGYAAWQTGDRLAELETLSVLPEHRGEGVGAALLEAVWRRLAEIGIDDLAVTAAKANVDSHRFYERNGFTQAFVVYYAKRNAPSARRERSGVALDLQ